MALICNNLISTLNISQNIFMVFFAIFGGAVFNVQPRFKAFQFPLIGRVDVVKYRVLLSFFVLNILPITYFIIVLRLLSNINHIKFFWILAFSGITPALGGSMGFYRLWLGIIELRPKCFYKSKRTEIVGYKGVEPIYSLSYSEGNKEPIIYFGNYNSGLPNII